MLLALVSPHSKKTRSTCRTTFPPPSFFPLNPRSWEDTCYHRIIRIALLLEKSEKTRSTCRRFRRQNIVVTCLCFIHHSDFLKCIFGRSCSLWFTHRIHEYKQLMTWNPRVTTFHLEKDHSSFLLQSGFLCSLVVPTWFWPETLIKS